MGYNLLYCFTITEKHHEHYYSESKNCKTWFLYVMYVESMELSYNRMLYRNVYIRRYLHM